MRPPFKMLFAIKDLTTGQSKYNISTHINIERGNEKMTTMAREKCKCAVCGAESEYRYTCSVTTYGEPDLDLRPAEDLRYTMDTWLQQCPECGYVSSEVSDATSVTKEWLGSEKYLTCDGISFESELAEQFYKDYLITLEEQNTKDAFHSLIHAAWSCDDYYDEENAKLCRELAATLAPEVIKKLENTAYDFEQLKAEVIQEIQQDPLSISYPLNENELNQVAEECAKKRIKDLPEKVANIKIVHADLLRRSGQFDRLIETYASVHFDDDLLNKILEFQIEKAKDKDVSCYSIEDVTGDNRQ